MNLVLYLFDHRIEAKKTKNLILLIKITKPIIII